MGGTQADSSGKHAVLQGAHAPVLGGMSEAELDAIVSQLRTDKNLTLAPVPEPRSKWGAVAERLLLSSRHRLDPQERQALREEAARHAWFVSLEERAAGPFDVAALREHWEEGKLGPDSLCWREGFEGWRPVCRVPELTETLVSLPDAELTPEATMVDEDAGAPDFSLKGAEALRALEQSGRRFQVTRPPLPFLVPESMPPLPVAPAALPAAVQARDAAGVHPVLPARATTQVEVRIRGGVWLAFGGGLAGGVLVALAVWLFGLGTGTNFRGASRPGTAPAAESVATAPAPVSTLAPVVASPSVLLPSSAVAAQPGETVPGPFYGLGPVLSPAGYGAPLPSLGSITAPVPPAGPLLAHSGPVEATKAEPQVARAVLPPPPARKLPKVELKKEVSAQPVSLDMMDEADEAVTAREEAVEEEDEDLGLDEEFARELDGPKQRVAAAPRTAYIPPAPAAMGQPASLGQSDIFAVVLANKGDVTECINAGKPSTDEDGGKVVVSWTIVPSGKVTQVATETAEHQGTPLAGCLEAKIRSWTFPKHSGQDVPVRFPFVF